MQLDSGFSCNTVIWFTSLPEDEQGPSRRMVEDMEALSEEVGVGFQRLHVNSASKLVELLEELTQHAGERQMRPLLHFDMHGNKEQGLFISGLNEYFSWDELARHLRQLNAATGNNLCAVGAACFGLRAIMPVKLDQPTPFFLLLAPEQEVTVGFLEGNVLPFYRELFRSGSIDRAYSSCLSDEFKYFHCEKMLFIAIARYIREGCKGKTGETRRERLLTEVFIQGMEKTEENLTDVRRKIKEGLRPNQALLDRYAKTFLIGRTCSFNMDQLLAFVNGYVS